jgi:NADPH-dependent curcumin reductase
LRGGAVRSLIREYVATIGLACPDGIDVYFENVGGAIWQAVLPLLNKFGRVSVSGLIAQYNGVGEGDGTDRLTATIREILSKSLTVRGFINYDFAAEHDTPLPARGRCRHHRWPHPLC